MEVSTLFLQRLSIIFQLSVVVLLALFFAVLARSVRLQEVRLWATAWLCNALGLTGVLFITFSPGIVLLDRLAIIGFLMGKTGYVILLVFGARHHLRPGLEPQFRRHLLVLFLFVWGVGLGFAVPSIFFAHIAQTLLVGVVLASGGVTVLRNPRSPISRWLGWALLLQGAVFLHVLAVIVPLMWGGEPVFNYIRIQSFFDAVTELFVALACLVAVADRSAEQMRATNLELEESHLRLSRLVDLDPLTGLANRRSLRNTLSQAKETGAAVIFLDIDDFKDINDRLGHQIGDLTLKRMARVLTENFRPEDRIFRWGGDEFLVIAPQLDRLAAEARIIQVRNSLSSPDQHSPRCSFSVGIRLLEAGGDPASVLDEADRMMYEEKRSRTPSGAQRSI